ncbi:MAG: hypothetical protein F6K26_19570 [Moorea sp. SIO2I5]|nr:hypothetical protein [Moorena sp. SIO2I5]
MPVSCLFWGGQDAQDFGAGRMPKILGRARCPLYEYSFKNSATHLL